jgi:hypothetical protein
VGVGRTRTIKAWLLPLIVAGLVIPGSAAFLLVGPGVGLAVGELCAAAVVVAAAFQRPEEPIEVASAIDGRTHVLVVATRALDEPPLVEETMAVCGDPDVDVLVLAPARVSPLSHWLSDVGPGREEAQVVLVHSIASLAAAGIAARGQVGDPDALQAVEDALRSFPADEVVLASEGSNHDRNGPRLAGELQRRLAIPFTHLAAERPSGRAARAQSS